MSEAQPSATLPEVKKEAQKAGVKPRKQPPYNVILVNDDDHTYEYVIEMLGKLFGHDPLKAFKMAQEVDNTGRVIVETTTMERAELKRDQIHAYGADPRMEKSKGSMRATIEPAPQ